MSSSPETKRAKTDDVTEMDTQPKCRFFVRRKKRYCRLTPAKGEEFCGEHLPVGNDTSKDKSKGVKKQQRVVCPLDPKHTVAKWNLDKHLKKCNALVKDLPVYIVPGINSGKDSSAEPTNFKLSDIDEETIEQVVEKVVKLYDEHCVSAQIGEMKMSHASMAVEIQNDKYAFDTVRHLMQISSLLSYVEHYKLLDDHISYVEYGAGKGQVSYWLAKAITNYPNSNVLLIDRASVRHKKDNKLDEACVVQRIRADIADFDISKHSLLKATSKIVGIGKHLCGAATDIAIRCSINGNNAATESDAKTVAMIIALCCHHSCDWANFVGKQFFMANNVSVKEFAIITKMVGWAVCGSGMSRERRAQLADEQTGEAMPTETKTGNRTRDERRIIGEKCKRILDIARIDYLKQHGFNCSLKQFVDSHVTLENVCLVAIKDN